jgi:xylulose-5-phosphate/fructose-6-phosphate phosphoketolase
MEALRRVPGHGERRAALTAECQAMLDSASAYSREHFEDPPEIRDWVWSED